MFYYLKQFPDSNKSILLLLLPSMDPRENWTHQACGETSFKVNMHLLNNRAARFFGKCVINKMYHS